MSPARDCPLREGSLVLGHAYPGAVRVIRRGIAYRATVTGIRIFWDDLGAQGEYTWKRVCECVEGARLWEVEVW